MQCNGRWPALRLHSNSRWQSYNCHRSKHLEQTMRALILALFAVAAFAGTETTVVYDGVASKLTDAVAEQDNLWLTIPDLTRSTRFVLKPQGACLDEFCVPIP